ncbi:MAG: serine hydrolase [Firmicutes bacterium]|nr:serine hydrolase [Bacillota bacterium]
MKKTRTFCLFICAVLLLCLLGGTADAQTDASVTGGCRSIDAAKPLDGTDKLLETSQAVILYERSSDTLIYAYNADQKVDPSSMAKLMTALIAVEVGDLSSVATVTREALSHVGIGVVTVKPRLQAGEKLTLESLLYCMVAASDNDAAVVIAEHIAGSQQAFVDMMNQRAKLLGCANTNFTNAHGLFDENACTTARDICRILNAALKNERFRTIFQAETYTVPATNKTQERNILTTNYMMSKEYTSKYFDARVTGGKTGTDGKGGRCLAVTAEENGMEMLAILFGAVPTYNADNPNILETFGSFEEMKVLLDHVGEKYEYRQIFYDNQTFSQYPVAGGSNDAVTTPVSAVSTVLPKDTTREQLRLVQSDVPSLTAPVSKGQNMGHIEVWYGEICVAQTDLVSMNAVSVYQAPPEPTGSAGKDEDSGGAVIATVIGVTVGIVLGAAALFFLVLLLIRSVRKASVRARRRRRRMNRQRSR